MSGASEAPAAIVHELPVPQTLPHLRARCGLPADTIRSGDRVHRFAATDHPEDVTCVGCLAVAQKTQAIATAQRGLDEILCAIDMVSWDEDELWQIQCHIDSLARILAELGKPTERARLMDWPERMEEPTDAG